VIVARSTLSDRTEALEAPRGGFRARRLGVIALSIGVVAVLVAVGVVASGKKGALAQLRVRGGTVEVDHGAKGFVRASDGSDVALGDIVRTQKGAQAVVDYFDGSVTRLDESSRIAIRKLDDAKDGRHIEFAIDTGRIWDRVKDATSSGDHFAVHLSNVTVSGTGATFLTDCRRSDACYVVAFDGTTHVASPSDQVDLNPGDCEQIAPDGSLTTCDASRLGLVDEWVRSNLAEDQELVTPSGSPTPAPTPSPSEVSSGTGRFVRRPVATRAPLRTPSKTAPPSTPVPTKDHNDDGIVTTPPPPSHKPHGSPSI
jgi:hypothetical protein